MHLTLQYTYCKGTDHTSKFDPTTSIYIYIYNMAIMLEFYVILIKIVKMGNHVMDEIDLVI
jgi:hypothetical protein